MVLNTPFAFSYPFTKSGYEFSCGTLTAGSASGYRNVGSGSLNNVGSNGYYWVAAPNSATNGRNLNFNSGKVYPLNSNNRANGFSVRAVQESNIARLLIHTMKTYSFEEVHELYFKAYLSARKHIRSHLAPLDFELNLEEYIYNDAKSLYERNYQPYPVRCFMAQDPTLREIFAPSIHDAAQSHILYDNLYPLFKDTFIYDSYSCCKGKGVLFGVNRFEHFLRSATNNWRDRAYVLSLDIVGYFTHINKGVLYNLICDNFERFKAKPIGKNSSTFWGDVIDFAFMDYLERIELFSNPLDNCVLIGDKSLRAKYPPHKSLFNAPPGTGVTIGRVTNCLNANIYLNPFDQWSKRVMKAKYYYRYADDIRVISPDLGFLEEYKAAATEFLDNKLKLTLHPEKSTIQSTDESIQFLGAVFRPFRRYCSNRSLGRFKQAVKQAEKSYQNNNYNINHLQSSLNSHLGRLRHFDERKAVDRALKNSALQEIFEFTPNYSKAVLRKEVN